jgi:hypothetical protein
MVFTTKRDTFLSVIYLVLNLILFFCGFLSFLFAGEGVLLYKWMNLIICLIAEALFNWMVIDIKYVLKDDHLFVKSGPFRSRIAYKDIMEVDKATDILIGYNLLASKDAIEIFYKGGLFNSVKISPRRKDEFLKELQSRNPDIKINSSCWS